MSDDAEKKFLIVDLDGTLCDIAHRVDLAKAGLWDDFGEALIHDGVIRATKHVLSYLSPFHHVIGLTGRDEKFSDLTWRWMNLKGIGDMFEDILMRPDGDFRPDNEIKIELLEGFFGDKGKVLENVILVLEDRDRVVTSLREYGLTVWQVRDGDY